MASTVEAPSHDGWRWAGRPPKLTALHRQHLALGATLVEHDGWLLPRSYGKPQAERAALRRAVGLVDIGEGGKISLQSDALEHVLAATFPGAIVPAIGHWTAADTVRIHRLTAEQALLVTPSAALQTTVDRFVPALLQHPYMHHTDLSGALCGLRLLGPRAYSVIERLCAHDLAPDRFSDGSLSQSAVARVHCLVARRDVLGTMGYDLYLDRDLGVYLWSALLEAGGPLEIEPVGRDAEEELR